jgi:hypothetical protein
MTPSPTMVQNDEKYEYSRWTQVASAGKGVLRGI